MRNVRACPRTFAFAENVPCESAFCVESLKREATASQLRFVRRARDARRQKLHILPL